VYDILSVHYVLMSDQLSNIIPTKQYSILFSVI